MSKSPFLERPWQSENPPKEATDQRSWSETHKKKVKRTPVIGLIKEENILWITKEERPIVGRGKGDPLKEWKFQVSQSS